MPQAQSDIPDALFTGTTTHHRMASGNFALASVAQEVPGVPQLMTALRSNGPVNVPKPDATTAPTASNAPTKLEARGLDFFYGANQALYDVSLDVPAKSVTALIGPSGCGKSTLFELLTGVKPDLSKVQHGKIGVAVVPDERFDGLVAL